MQYALLIYTDETSWQTRTPDEIGAEMAGYQAFGQEHESKIAGGDALHPTATATSVRVRDGERLLTDGPFAETREQLGGFYLVNADSLDDAIEMAAKIPGASTGVVEVRPVMQFDENGRPLDPARQEANS
ncbi:MAG: hypothetical protein QOE86_1792 [Solirubrobacteraceae bacterium]|jgi:hypothetical protein|nr:hypothetical protein [Solirubrobacteraceae bacterium]